MLSISKSFSTLLGGLWSEARGIGGILDDRTLAEELEVIATRTDPFSQTINALIASGVYWTFMVEQFDLSQETLLTLSSSQRFAMVVGREADLALSRVQDYHKALHPWLCPTEWLQGLRLRAGWVRRPLIEFDVKDITSLESLRVLNSPAFGNRLASVPDGDPLAFMDETHVRAGIEVWCDVLRGLGVVTAMNLLAKAWLPGIPIQVFAPRDLSWTWGRRLWGTRTFFSPFSEPIDNEAWTWGRSTWGINSRWARDAEHQDDQAYTYHIRVNLDRELSDVEQKRIRYIMAWCSESDMGWVIEYTQPNIPWLWGRSRWGVETVFAPPYWNWGTSIWGETTIMGI